MVDLLAKEGIFSLRLALRRPGFRVAYGPAGNKEPLGPVWDWGKYHRSSSGATVRAH